jgi:hypothetical protein
MRRFNQRLVSIPPGGPDENQSRVGDTISAARRKQLRRIERMSRSMLSSQRRRGLVSVSTRECPFGGVSLTLDARPHHKKIEHGRPMAATC